MGVDTLGIESPRRGSCVECVFAQEVAHAEAGQPLPTAIPEQRFGRGQIDAELGEQRAEGLRGLRPERTKALLPALASESNLERTRKLEIARPHVEDLLHASPR